jgi:hypothetical protein
MDVEERGQADRRVLAMQLNRWLFVALLIVAAVVGAGGVIASVAVNR